MKFKNLRDKGKILFGILKKAILFGNTALVVLFSVSILTYYILVEYIGMEFETSAMIGGVISAIIIVVMDRRKSRLCQKQERAVNALGN